jgi:hypothetical protein
MLGAELSQRTIMAEVLGDQITRLQTLRSG